MPFITVFTLTIDAIKHDIIYYSFQADLKRHVEDGAKKLHDCMNTLCKHLLCSTNLNVKTVVSTLQSLLSFWTKYKKASLIGLYNTL